jgi:two-component system LytT family sensor kinase
MAVLPFNPTPFFRPTPFFGNKNRAFWQLELLGWGGSMLLRVVSSLANAQPWSFLVIVLIATITGFSISMILSVIYRALINRRPLITWGVTTLVLALAVGLYAFIDSWVISLYRPSTEQGFAQLFLGAFYLDLTLLGAWSALYYAINFFLQVEERNDQLLKLEAQATSAQLAMLRYQLNPHFLFNTLNSISTLVLLKQTEPANAMLSRLSSFLRHTLVNDATARVTVGEEVETLKLYLDIERMRFEERLRTHFIIEDAAKNALMPSLLLQPLVENAIKYAVSALEEGAEITVSAQLVGPMLRVTVSDTGPGLQSDADLTRSSSVTSDSAEPTQQPSIPLPGSASSAGHNSTGLGLNNIRDRLAQAYGDNQVFEASNRPEGGFQVMLELPFEARVVLTEANNTPPQRAMAALGSR